MLFWLVAAPILAAVFLYAISSEKAGRAISLIIQVALTCCVGYVFLKTRVGGAETVIGGYDGVLGVALQIDRLSGLVVLLTTFLFLVAAIYSYNDGSGRLYRFLMFIWEGLLIGVFLSRDLFNIFVLIEVATVVVSILIMFKRENRSMYDGMVYLMVNTIAIQFYLFGVGYIYKLTGVLDMEAATLALKAYDKSTLALPYALIMTAVSLKCALMPLFSWLPKAHGTPGAPSAVSAILSGLHIKSGIYLFIRFSDVFQVIDLSTFFLVAGIITGIAGFTLALAQSDIKLILAYHTISQIGMIMIGLTANDVSYTGGVYHIVNHALFKSALFLCAGIIIETYGTRDVYKIRGVLRRAPSVGIATLMAILGITGAPFFNGSISKYFIMTGADWFVTGATMFINLGTIISFIKFSSMLFGSPGTAAVKVSNGKQIAVITLGILCLAGGIFGEQSIEFMFDIDISVNTLGYFQKSGLFAFSVAAGYLVYRYYIKSGKLLERIREIELGFRGICVSIGIFFAIILLAVKFLAA